MSQNETVPNATLPLGAHTTTQGGSSPKADLFALTGPLAGRRFTIEANALIGREATAEIQIPGDDVSRRHAVIWPTGSGEFIIEDQRSRNGTLVNGIPVEVHVLQFGDKVQIGSKSLFVFTHYHALEDQLILWQRIELISQLSAGLMHDFNNYMAALLGYIQYLKQFAGLSQSLPELQAVLTDSLPVMESAAEEGTALAQRVLGFARSAKKRRQAVDLAQLADEAVRLLRRNLAGNIQVTVSVGASAVIAGDRTEILQVLINLLLNARDAMPDGGAITIGGGGFAAGATGELPQALQGLGKQVVLWLKDTGQGMSAETRRHIFEPLFTTKEKGKGTGLGLSMVSLIIENHGGQIHVQSAPAAGSTFWISLPPALKAKESSGYRRASTTQIFEQMPELAAIPRSGGLVLVLDSGEIMRQRAIRVLYSLGYGVLLAQSEGEALELCRRYRDRMRLVILNLDLPGIDGAALCAQLRAIKPDARILATSSQTREQPKPTPDIARLLQAGCDTQTFSRAISELLRD